MVYIVKDRKTGRTIDPGRVLEKVGLIASINHDTDTLSVDFVRHGEQFRRQVGECGWTAEEYDSVKHGPFA